MTKVYAAARDPKTIDATDPRGVSLQLDVTDADSVHGLPSSPTPSAS